MLGLHLSLLVHNGLPSCAGTASVALPWLLCDGKKMSEICMFHFALQVSMLSQLIRSHDDMPAGTLNTPRTNLNSTYHCPINVQSDAKSREATQSFANLFKVGGLRVNRRWFEVA